ncbi:hypothetical protein BX616_006198 [Lobosporangium transversale]|uniref:rRNA-processing protein n=1 Tax=Lobosporangium transversale TaxID=64571 RepID=A0A1Y2GLI5_9FUNG|nr:hypothetical protein BCR41DRAFT_371197 [Lobosporangium transversale]KAF9915418.1 hypothetical protein BX616_006198 [Lobosporangium transversale]ORZ14368.1 hypothetical protein BCR41DRAFT_371197 [Lobosporangium transversale]|eukprot:XP_021880846.1 hypothetical protein BCR41DRAFT_371197 [Lobosporangium transversale]
MTAKQPTPQEPSSRVSGKEWKLAKAPTRRSQMPKALKQAYTERMAKTKQHDIVRNLAKSLTQEKIDEKRRKREITEERKKIQEEKERVANLAAKMSANKLKRLKKKAGNLKGR